MTGIYGVQCVADGRWYVGKSANLNKRNTDEKRQLNMGKFHNKPLQKAWSKQGADGFSWHLLEYCPAEKLNEREAEWIAKLNSYTNGFNLTIGGGGTRGYKHTREWRKQASERNSNGKSPRLGKPISEEAKRRMRANIFGAKSPRARPIVQLTGDGVQIAVYGSIADAARTLGINPAHISSVCLNRPKRKTAGGFVWRYKVVTQNDR